MPMSPISLPISCPISLPMPPTLRHVYSAVSLFLIMGPTDIFSMNLTITIGCMRQSAIRIQVVSRLARPKIARPQWVTVKRHGSCRCSPQLFLMCPKEPKRNLVASTKPNYVHHYQRSKKQCLVSCDYRQTQGEIKTNEHLHPVSACELLLLFQR